VIDQGVEAGQRGFELPAQVQAFGRFQMQLEAQLVMRNYEGFARKGRLRGRR